MFKTIMSVVFVVALILGGAYFDGRFDSKPTEVASGIQPQQQSGVSDVVQSVTNVVNVVSNTQDNSFNRVIKAERINVGVMNPSKPFFSVDSGRAKGFNVDFLKLMLKQSEFAGVVQLNTDNQVDTYEAVPGMLLSSKSVDIVADGLTFTNDDMPGVVYSIPYVKDFGYSLIVPKGTSMTSASDTAGARVGVLKGDPDAKAFVETAFPQAKVIELSDRADSNGKWIVGHIKSGTVDAVVYDYPFAVAEVEGTDLQFAMTKIEGSDIQYKIGVRKEDKELLGAINSAIRKAMADESYPEMLKSYFMSNNVVATRRASAAEEVYIVSRGDTLSTIAQAKLGDMKKYVLIQARNNLANPNFISVGQKLVIPTGN
jgi:ABC-type amino acid transport substrate-binding protein